MRGHCRFVHCVNHIPTYRIVNDLKEFFVSSLVRTPIVIKGDTKNLELVDVCNFCVIDNHSEFILHMCSPCSKWCYRWQFQSSRYSAFHETVPSHNFRNSLFHSTVSIFWFQHDYILFQGNTILILVWWVQICHCDQELRIYVQVLIVFLGTSTNFCLLQSRNKIGVQSNTN